MEIPPSLRAWFAVHGVVQVLFAISMLLFPEALLPRLGWTVVDPVTTRLLGAACLAIGGGSWRVRRAGMAEYGVMLPLNVIWSSAAIVGLTIAIARGAPPVAVPFVAVNLLFCGVWVHHVIRFRQLARAPEDGLSDESSPADASDEDATAPQNGPSPSR